MELLTVKNLRTTFRIQAGLVRAVRGIDFHVDAGEAVGIVGESGSGKSVSMLSVMHLLPENADIQADVLNFDGLDMTKATYSELRSIQGNRMGMLFQDPMTSLNPLMPIGRQIMEPLRLHKKMSREEAKARTLELLRLVEMPSPESRLKQYPHEFSGGMRQRAMIAIAIACDPKLVIADEPTTALDVTIQAQILELLQSLKKKLNTSIVMITHDLGVIASMCSRIVVMYGGMIVEEGTAREIFYEPRHPYTWGLLRSIPKAAGGEKKKLIPIPGTPPDLLMPPQGCPFMPRCPHAMEVCKLAVPGHTRLSDTHACACHLMSPLAPKVEREEV